MDLTPVVIAPEQGAKGRSFRALHLASTVANALWKGGETKANVRGDDVARPVCAVFLGSEAEMTPFAANLRVGRLVQTLGGVSHSYRKRKAGFEFLRSAGYKQAIQTHPEGVILTVYLPELYNLDPGMVDPKEIKFVLAPSAPWVASQGDVDADAIVRYARKLPLVREVNTPPKEEWRQKHFGKPLPDERLRQLVPTAYLFAAYLDRRTRAPLIADGRFFLQVMLACLRKGLATFSADLSGTYNETPFGEHRRHGFAEDFEDGSGFLPGVAFQGTHLDLETLLAAEVATYYDITKGR